MGTGLTVKTDYLSPQVLQHSDQMLTLKTDPCCPEGDRPYQAPLTCPDGEGLGFARANSTSGLLILYLFIYLTAVPTMQTRLQKILSQWGIASRRQAETMIQQGRVRVNGQIVHLGQTANPEVDQIEVDGQIIQPSHRPELVYLLLYKPAGVVSTCSDPRGRPTVLDLLPLPMQNQGIHPVGRLDFLTTGALLLTNDGELTYQLTHPKHGIAKTYQVWVKGHPPESVLAAWRSGVMLDGRPTLPAEVRMLKQDEKTHQTLLQVVLKEGRNRQIRRVAALLGYPVVDLHRSAIGPITLGRRNADPESPSPHQPSLSPGDFRPLTPKEINFLRGKIF